MRMASLREVLPSRLTPRSLTTVSVTVTLLLAEAVLLAGEAVTLLPAEVVPSDDRTVSLLSVEAEPFDGRAARAPVRLRITRNRLRKTTRPVYITVLDRSKISSYSNQRQAIVYNIASIKA